MAADFLADEIAHADLTGYIAIDDDAAETLASVGKVETRTYNQELNIFAPDIKTISEKTAKALSGHEGDLCFNSLESLEPDAARWLVQSRCQQLHLLSLADISEPVICLFGSFQGDSLSLGLKDLSARAAEALSQRTGCLALDDLQTLSDDAAKALSCFMPNAWLSLDGLTELTDVSAAALAKRNGWLSVKGLQRISKEASSNLAALEKLETNKEIRKFISKAKRRMAPDSETSQKNRPIDAKLSNASWSSLFDKMKGGLIAIQAPNGDALKAMKKLIKPRNSWEPESLEFNEDTWSLFDNLNIFFPFAEDISRELDCTVFHLAREDASGMLVYMIFQSGKKVEEVMLDSEVTFSSEISEVPIPVTSKNCESPETFFEILHHRFKSLNLKTSGLDDVTIVAGKEKPKKGELKKIMPTKKLTPRQQIKQITEFTDEHVDLINEVVKKEDLMHEQKARSMTPAAAKAFASHDCELVIHLEHLGADVARELAKNKQPIELKCISSISDEEAKALSLASANKLYLPDVSNISDNALRELTKFKGTLDLSGLTSISNSAAQALATHEGDLWLNGLTSISDSAAEVLVLHKGKLTLYGLSSLSASAAKSFRSSKRTIKTTEGIPITKGS